MSPSLNIFNVRIIYIECNLLKGFIKPEILKKIVELKTKKSIENILLYKSKEENNKMIFIIFFEKFFTIREKALEDFLDELKESLNIKILYFKILNLPETIEKMQFLANESFFIETLDGPK